MAVLEHLEPKNVFRFFEGMCAIPHGSFNTKAISDWCVAFARERGLEHYQDEANNVIIIKEASAGYESAEPVIIQGHLDMVCEKAPDCPKDMAREGLDLAVDGDWVHAKGTTLGGDDGIAVAMALAALDDDSLSHPRLEVILTTEEEMGMEGAAALDVTPIRGRKLINIDSEEEGIFTVSCAGGVRAGCTLPVSRAAFDGEAVLSVTIGGLAGGHSGVEIHKQRGNANMLLGRVLRAVSKASDMRIICAGGGQKDNAIPAESGALLAVKDCAAAMAAVAAEKAAIQNELQTADPGVSVQVETVENPDLPMDQASTQRVICMLTCAPCGVQTMSLDIPGLVQTSLNLGVLKTAEDHVLASFSIRSSVASEKALIRDRLVCLTEMLGGSVSCSGDYPAWEYRKESPLRDLMIEIYKEQYSAEPRVEAIHAGLECGLLSAKLPGLDCVSIGPELRDIHTPRERMSVASVQRVWAFVLEILRRSK